MEKISLTEILKRVREYEVIGNENCFVTELLPVDQAKETSLVFIDKNSREKEELILTTKAQVIICDHEVKKYDIKGKSIVIVDNPKLTFAEIGNYLFRKNKKWGIDPSAIIHPDSKIHPKSYIGPFCYIGNNCEIGEGSFLHGNIYIYDANVSIGRNVIIHAGCIIGSNGFGFIKNESDELINFPHIGGVIIEDNVELGVLTHVDSGALGSTIIKSGTKIDNCCHIAHNDVIGRNNMIVAHTMLGGSVRLGDDCYVGPSSAIRDGIKIGDNSFIGMGSLVASDFEENSKIMGNPATSFEEFKKMRKNMKEYLNDK